MMERKLEEYDDAVVSFEMMVLVFLELREAQATASLMRQAPSPVGMKDAIHLVTERCSTAVFS
jgi:hypothetical protein